MGSSYTFKASFSNGISYSAFSSPFQLLALDPPLSPFRPLTLISANTTIAQFQITPHSLAEAGGDPNPEYFIFFKQKSSTGNLQPLSSHSSSSLLVTFNYTENSLTLNQVYEVVYQIKTKFGTAEQLSPVALFATATVPSAPNNWLTVQAISSSAVLLTWQSGVDSAISQVSLTGFEIQRDNGYNSGVFKSIYETNSLSIRKVEIHGLTAALTYRFRLVALNINGKSEPSSSSSILVCGPLGFLEGPQLMNRNSTSALIQWSAPQDTGGCSVSAYKVYINDGVGGAFPDTPATSISDISYAIPLTSADLGKQYRVKVTVVSISGATRTSGVLTFIYALIPDKPSILIRDNSNPEAKGVTLKIENTNSSGGVDIDRFQVYRQYGPSQWKLIFSSFPSQQLSFLDTGLFQSGGIVLYKYRAHNIAGWSDFSQILYARFAQRPKAPIAPTLKNITAGWMLLTLTGTQDDGGAPILGYSLYHDSGDNFSSSFVKISGFTGGQSVNISATTLGNPTQGTLFRFRYTAYNEIGESEASQLIIEFSPIPTDMPSLYKEQSHKSVLNQYKLYWQMPQAAALNITGFRLFCDFAGAYGEQVYTSIYEGPSDIMHFTFYNASLHHPQTTVKFKLQPQYFNGGGSFSNILSVTGCQTPSGLSPPTITHTTKTSVEVEWKGPSNTGKCNITSYHLSINSSFGSGSFSLIDDANIKNKPFLTNTTLDLSSFTPGEYYQLKLTVDTQDGINTSSEAVAFLLAGVPVLSNSLVQRDKALTLYNPALKSIQLGLKLPQVADAGGVPLHSFEVFVKLVSSTSYTQLVIQDDLSLNFHFNLSALFPDISLGQSVLVKYRAKNQVGYSDFSNQALILLATKPDTPKPASLLTRVSSSSVILDVSKSKLNISNGAQISRLRVYRDSGNFTDSVSIQETSYDGADVNVTLSNLVPATIYRVGVKLQNEEGTLSDLSEVIVFKAGLPPSAPSNLTRVTSSSSSITLMWDRSQVTDIPIQRYIMEYVELGGENRTQTVSVAPQLNQVSIRLKSAQIYRFRVSAEYFNQRTAYSNQLLSQICGAPTPPLNFQIDAFNLTAVTLSWNEPLNSDGCAIVQYRLYRDDGAGGTVTQQIHTSDLQAEPLLRSIVVTELPTASLGKVIRFALVAVNEAGLSQPSYIALQLVGAPDTPTDEPVIIERLNSTSIRMSVNGVGLDSGGLPLQSYRFEIAKEDTQTYFLIQESLQSQIAFSSFNGFNITPGDRYKSHYRAKNKFSYSTGYSPAISFLACYQPSRPSISRVLSVFASNLTLQFQNPADLGGGHSLTFQLYIAEQRTGTYSKVSTYDGLTSTHTLTVAADSLVPGKTYYFKLRVTNESGLWSLFSDILMVGLGAAPLAPTSIRHELSLTGTDSIGIAWDAASDTDLPILGYRVFARAQTSSQMALVLDTSLLHPGRDTILAFSLKNAGLGQTYIVQMGSVNINGMGLVSDTVSLKSCVALDKQAIPLPDTSVESSSRIEVSWDGIINSSGCQLLNLKVMWSNPDSGSLVNESSALPRSQSNYTVSGLSSLGSVYTFALKGQTAISTVQGHSMSILLATRPRTPTIAPSVSRTNAAKLEIHVSQASSSDGNGASVSQYQLEMNSNGTFINLGKASGLTFSLYRGIHYTSSLGSQLYFRYRFINSLGVSDPSPELGLIVADPPSRCENLQLHNVTASGGIFVNMTQLTDTGGAALDNYTIEYSLESEHKFSTYKVYSTFQQMDVLLASLTPGTIYRFRIFASNVIGSGLPSRSLVVALADLPEVPSAGSLTVSSSTTSNITLQWTAGTSAQLPVSGYRLYFDQNQSGNYSLLYDGFLKPNERQYTHSSLTKGNPYRYRLSVLNFNGESPLLATPLQAYACNRPAIVPNFTATTLNSTAVKLAWSQPQDNGGCSLSGYQLQIDDGNSGSYAALTGSPFSSTILEHTETATFNSSHLGRTFRFRISPVNVIGSATQYSSAQALLAEKPPTPSSAPTYKNSTLSSITVEMGVVSNTAGAAIDWYQLQMDDGLSGDFSVIFGSTAQLERIYQVKSLIAGRFYSFRYRVHNEIGWSQYSPIVKYQAVSKPSAPPPPLFINSTSSSLFIKIQPSSQNGGSTILSYAVYWDSGVYGSSFTHLVGSKDSPFLDTFFSLTSGLIPGNYYNFKVKAMNAFGVSDFSEPVRVRAVSVPAAVSTVGFILDYDQIRISWSAPDNHGSPILNYTILFKNAAGSGYSLSNCDGTSAVVILNTFCVIPMSSLSALPLTLSYNADILLQISSANELGSSPRYQNQASSVKVITVPQTPSSAPSQGSSTSHTTIHVTWSALTTGAERGGADILEYELVWDEGNSTAASFSGVLLTNALALEYMTSTSITAGTTYRFKYRARNLLGSGGYSDIGSVLAASAPEAPNPPNTSTLGLDVKIDWSAPTNNGSPIQNYTVTVMNATGAYVQVTGCNGTLSTNVENTQCTVLMSTLRDELGLAYGANILAKVKATNQIGTGPESNATDATGAATIETPPQTPGNVAASKIYASNLTLSWNSLESTTETGGQPIKSYIVEYKAKSASAWITAVGGSTVDNYFIGNTTIIGSLNTATIYEFRVSALNVHGQSATTNPVLEATTGIVNLTLAAAPPEAPSAPTTTNDNLNVKIDWSAPANNGSPIQNYTITVLNASGNYVEVTGCDGTDATVILNTECTVLMATLRTDLGLAYGANILAKVKATNLIGSGQESSATVSSGAATVQTAPQTPANLAASDIQNNSMTLSWNALTSGAETGGSAILSYILDYKLKTASSWTRAKGGDQAADYFTGTSTSVGSLASATAYEFRVSALNIHGQSATTTPVLEATTLT